MSDKKPVSPIFAILVVLVFLRPLISGMGGADIGYRPFLDILLRVSILLVFLRLLIRKKNGGFIYPAPVYAVVLWLVWSLISVAAAYMNGRGLFVSLQRIDIYVSLVATGVVVASTARSEKEREAVLKALLCAGLVSALYGLWQYFAGFDRTMEYLAVHGVSGFEGSGNISMYLKQKRVFSTTFSPDMMAGLMAVMVLLAAAFSLEMRKKGKNGDFLLGLVTAITCFSALYLTGSLGGMLALGAGGLIIIFRAATLNGKYRIPALLLIIVVIIGVSGIVVRRSQIITNLDHPHNPVVQRLNYWKGGLSIITDNPLSGVGPGHFGNAYLSIKPEKAGETRYAHNAVVQYASEMGIPGFIFFLLIAYAFFKYSMKYSSKSLMGVGILGGGCAFLAHSMIDYDTEIIEVASVFWVLIGLSASFYNEEKEGSGVNGIRRVAVIIPFLLVLIFEITAVSGLFFMQKAKKRMGQGDIERASIAVNRAVALRKWDPSAAGLEAEVYSKMKGGYARSEAALKRLIEIDSMDPLSWMNIGSFYLNTGNDEKAAVAFEEAARLYPAFPAARGMADFARARVMVKNGNLGGAKSKLMRVLDIFPEHTGALEGLKYIKRLENGGGQ